LKKKKLFEVPVMEYNKAIHIGYFESFSIEIPDSLKQRPKAAYIFESDVTFIENHKFCLNELTKTEVEKNCLRI
jgi:hypothetical protein